jgi:hypothetical protein
MKTKEKTKATYVIFKKTKKYHIKWIKKEQNAGGWKKKNKETGVNILNLQTIKF